MVPKPRIAKVIYNYHSFEGCLDVAGIEPRTSGNWDNSAKLKTTFANGNSRIFLLISRERIFKMIKAKKFVEYTFPCNVSITLILATDLSPLEICRKIFTVLQNCTEQVDENSEEKIDRLFFTLWHNVVKRQIAAKRRREKNPGFLFILWSIFHFSLWTFRDFKIVYDGIIGHPGLCASLSRFLSLSLSLFPPSLHASTLVFYFH